MCPNKNAVDPFNSVSVVGLIIQRNCSGMYPYLHDSNECMGKVYREESCTSVLTKLLKCLKTNSTSKAFEADLLEIN